MYTIASSETKFEEKFKQGCSTMQQISAKRTTTSHPKSLKTKKTTRYDVGNPGLKQAQTVAVLSMFNRIPILSSC